MEDKSPTSRRKFLVKASAGALISTIPAKSVWATGLTNSIVASGHGSDMGGTTPLKLRGVNYWRNNPDKMGMYKDMPFTAVFGANAFKDNYGGRYTKNLTLGEIMTAKNAKDKYKYRGPGNINHVMISIVMNAYNHNKYDIHYPIVGVNKPFSSVESLGLHLNRKFPGTATYYSEQLKNVLTNVG